MAGQVLTFVIVGQQDHPIYEVDLIGPKEVRCAGLRRLLENPFRDQLLPAAVCMMFVNALHC